MLRNPFDMGYVKHKDKMLPEQHTPIITQELFDQVQKVRKDHFVGPSTFAPRYRTYLLKGLPRRVQCGERPRVHNIRNCDYYQETSSQRGIRYSNEKDYIRAEVSMNRFQLSYPVSGYPSHGGKR